MNHFKVRTLHLILAPHCVRPKKKEKGIEKTKQADSPTRCVCTAKLICEIRHESRVQTRRMAEKLVDQSQAAKVGVSLRRRGAGGAGVRNKVEQLVQTT